MITGNEGLGDGTTIKLIDGVPHKKKGKWWVPVNPPPLPPGSVVLWPTPGLGDVIDAALALPPMGKVPFTYPTAPLQALEVSAMACMQETADEFMRQWHELPTWLKEAIPKMHVALPAQVAYAERRLVWPSEALVILASG